MITILSLIIGIIVALALVRFARTKTPRDEKQIYSLALVAAALIYVVFALSGGASLHRLMLEGLGVFFYGGMAWLGLSVVAFVALYKFKADVLLVVLIGGLIGW
jgi:ABC-type amino acid transport system permease subunit